MSGLLVAGVVVAIALLAKPRPRYRWWERWDNIRGRDK